MITICKFEEEYYEELLLFLEKCLPESGRQLELNGRHKIYCNISKTFDGFWCLFDEKNIIGTVALKKIDSTKCELKSLYLLQKYHGKRWGYCLLKMAIRKAQEMGYREMYLDTLSTSTKAIRLYEEMGFAVTERYNTNEVADLFMVLTFNREKG